MLDARREKRWSQGKLAESAGVRLSDVAEFERLSFTMPDAEGKAARVAAALGVATDDVMPEGAAGQAVESKRTRCVDVEAQGLLSEARHDRMVLPSPDEIAAERDEVDTLRARLAMGMGRLTDREQQVLKLRFGLGDGNGETLTHPAVGRAIRVSAVRARQISDHALRKLRANCTSWPRGCYLEHHLADPQNDSTCGRRRPAGKGARL